MTRRIVLSPAAQAQLDDLYDYIADAASPAAALRFTDAILNQLEALRDFPNVGTARDDLLSGLRTMGFRRRVTIAFVAEPTEVLVVGLYYGGRDFEALLRED